MPDLVKRRWEPDYRLAGNRKATQAFDYEAYLPDPIARLDLSVPLSLAEELAVTVQLITELQGNISLTGLETLSRHLLRAESIGSSRIEGLRLSQRRLARAMLDPAAETETARAVVGNIEAMEEAIRIGERGGDFQVKDIQDIHARLLSRTSDARHAGQLRQEQNWIGGSDWSPRGAEFVPPPEWEVERLLDDLCAFLQRTDLPAIIQAAIIHAQFETIHPFADGNGRVGRALIHVVLRRRGLTPRFVPPVSLVLATNAQRYVDGLTAYRNSDIAGWCRFFTRALYSATGHASQLNQDLGEMQKRWWEAAGQPRRNSAAQKLIQALPAQPILDLKTATSLTGGSDEGARKALNELEKADVLSPAIVGKKKNRMWEARDLLALLDTFEWELATPTRSGEPRRTSPPRH